tara:strand:+ start:507 stop:692 length:186 start_codon:yes stop_codon:yes gene_type:complete
LQSIKSPDLALNGDICDEVVAFLFVLDLLLLLSLWLLFGRYLLVLILYPLLVLMLEKEVGI